MGSTSIPAPGAIGVIRVIRGCRLSFGWSDDEVTSGTRLGPRRSKAVFRCAVALYAALTRDPAI